MCCKISKSVWKYGNKSVYRFDGNMYVKIDDCKKKINNTDDI